MELKWNSFTVRSQQLTKARNPGTLVKVNPSQVKSCNSTTLNTCNCNRNELLLRYEPYLRWKPAILLILKYFRWFFQGYQFTIDF